MYERDCKAIDPLGEHPRTHPHMGEFYFADGGAETWQDDNVGLELRSHILTP